MRSTNRPKLRLVSGRLFAASMGRRLAFLLLAGWIAGVSVPRALAAESCAIANSACYPWRIPAGKREASLLKVIPRNTITGAIYRVCLCAPGTSAELLFRFAENDVPLGRIAAEGGPVCRDFRIETARNSELVVRRVAGSGDSREPDTSASLTGCYVSAATSP